MNIATRRIDSSAITALAPVLALLPVWLISTAIFWIPFGILGGVSFSLFAISLLSLGIVLFSRPVQRLIFARLLGARSPTPTELVQLDLAWQRVAQANHFSPNRFVLAVADGDDINAFACGGHLLVVSSYAIHNLDTQELSGILAHELSHHLGGHTVALTIAQWMSLPVITLARVGFSLQRIAQAATNMFDDRFPNRLVRLVGRVITGILSGIAWIFLAGLLFAQSLGNVVGRGAEYQADSRAVEMGFGRELLSALKRVVESGHSEVFRGWSAVALATHPPARIRIARLEAMLRRESSSGSDQQRRFR